MNDIMIRNTYHNLNRRTTAIDENESLFSDTDIQNDIKTQLSLYTVTNSQSDGGDIDVADLPAFNRDKSIYFQNKIECWLSMDINLIDILLQDEIFTIRAWLSVFWQDNQHNDFQNLFEEDMFNLMKRKGCIKYEDLDIEIRKKLPFTTSFLKNATDIHINVCHLELYDQNNPNSLVWKLYFDFE
eukprot:227863_1